MCSGKSNEDRECRTRRLATSWSCHSQVICSRWQDNPTSLGHFRPAKKMDENLENHSHLTVVRQMRGETRTTTLVVTLQEGGHRGTCSAALKELLNIIKDQIEQQRVVVFVLNRRNRNLE